MAYVEPQMFIVPEVYVNSMAYQTRVLVRSYVLVFAAYLYQKIARPFPDKRLLAAYLYQTVNFQRSPLKSNVPLWEITWPGVCQTVSGEH